MTTFKVDDMSCGHCTTAIRDSIRSIDPGASVDCDLERHIVQVDSALDADALAGAIREAGYEPVKP